MKTIIINKDQGCYEKSSIRSFNSITEARKNGYSCKDKHFCLDAKDNIMLTEHIYSSDDMTEQEECRTLIKNSSIVRVFSDAEFIDIYGIDKDMLFVPSMMQHDREIEI